MIIVGCDPSSKKLAFSGVNSDIGIRKHTFAILGSRWEPENALSAYANTQDFISTLITPGIPTIGSAYIEEPVIGANRRAGIVQAYVAGAVMAAMADYGLDVVTCQSSEWKKAIIGKGNANKEEVKEGLIAYYAANNLPPLTKTVLRDQDMIDAAAIFEYGRLIELRAEKVI